MDEDLKFEKLAADPDFSTLQGISEFDDNRANAIGGESPRAG